MRSVRSTFLAFALVLSCLALPAGAGNYRPLKPAPKKTPAAGTPAARKGAPAPTVTRELRGKEAREHIADLAPPRPVADVPYPVIVDPKTGEKVIVITNEVLERRFGRPSATPPPPGASIPMPGAVASLIEDQRKEEEARRQAEAAARERQRKILQLEQEIAHLERRILSIRNPLYRMPPRTEEDRKEDETARSNAERLAAAQARLKKLREELARLKAQGTP